MQRGCDSDHKKNYASAEEGDSEREGEIGPRDEVRGVVHTHRLNLHNIAVRQPGVNNAQDRVQVGNNAPSHSDLIASFVIDIPEEAMTAPPRLVGTDTLPKLNVKAADMKRELEQAFDKYENFFTLNYIKSGAAVTATEREVKASILQQYIGDAAMDGIYPSGRDHTKTYEELKKAIKDRFRPTYANTLLRSQFICSTMREGQSSRDFLQSLWEGIRKTSCTDADEQLRWALTCFTSRHSNSEVRKAFELKPPSTEAEALATVNDVESKQQDRRVSEKLTAVLRETESVASPNEIATVNTRRGYGGNRRGEQRGGFGNLRSGNSGSYWPQNRAADCQNCGGTSWCRNGQCPACGAACFECGKSGHLAKVCPIRGKIAGNRGGANNNRYPKPKPTNKCNTAAGAGYTERAKHQRWNEQAQRATTYEEQEEVGYAKYPQLLG